VPEKIDKRPTAESQDLRGMPADSSRLYEPWPGANRSVHFAEAAIMLQAKVTAQHRRIDRMSWTRNNRDLGRRPGPPAVNPLMVEAQARARELLDGGWWQNKDRLAKKISDELKRRHENDEQPPRCAPGTVARWITERRLKRSIPKIRKK
jgi:hypothetical protein